jgi:predicted transcriptional regulator
MIRRKANNRGNGSVGNPSGTFLDLFGLSSPSKQVLMDIVSNGTSTVADISARLNMPKSTIYDAIAPLLEQSLVNEYNDGRGRSYGVSETDQIVRAQNERLEAFKSAQASLLSLVKDSRANDSVARPKIKFYAGTLGVKQAFRDMMWQKDIKETVMFWPTRTMIGIDEEFFKWHGTQRFKYNVFIYAIELHEDRKIQGVQKHDWLRNTKDNLVEVRYLPKGVDCKMSFWLYGNKCLFASGGAEKIAFTVHSKEFAQMMKLLWQSLWAQAKK